MTRLSNAASSFHRNIFITADSYILLLLLITTMPGKFQLQNDGASVGRLSAFNVELTVFLIISELLRKAAISIIRRHWSLLGDTPPRTRCLTSLLIPGDCWPFWQFTIPNIDSVLARQFPIIRYWCLMATRRCTGAGGISAGQMVFGNDILGHTAWRAWAGTPLSRYFCLRCFWGWLCRWTGGICALFKESAVDSVVKIAAGTNSGRSKHRHSC